MAKLLERLVAEGYVRDDRKTELLDRAHHLQAGNGFLTTAETRRSSTEEDLLS